MRAVVDRGWLEADEDDGIEADMKTRAILEQELEHRHQTARRALDAERARKRREATRPVKLGRMHTVQHFASLLGYDPDTIRQWIREGILHAEYIRGEYRILESDMTAFIAEERAKRGNKGPRS